MKVAINLQYDKIPGVLGPVNVLCCTGCGRVLGEAMCTIELLERWINDGGDSGFAEVSAHIHAHTFYCRHGDVCHNMIDSDTCGGGAVYQADMLSDVRLLTHRISLQRRQGAAVHAVSVRYEQVRILK